MKARRIISVVLILLFLCMTGLIVWAKNRHDKKNIPVERMPEIKALTLSGDSVSFSIEDIKKRTAIMFFHPECEFCEEEIKGIIEHKMDFSDIQWVFLTMAQSDEVNDFLAKYQMGSIPDSYLFREDYPAMHITFGVTAPPYMLIYDESGILMKKYRGATSIKVLIEDLK